MIDLTKLDDVKSLQSDLRATFDTPSGKVVMSFLEGISGWFDFHETDRDRILVGHGKRQVVASIKTLLTAKAEQIVALAKEKEA
jgi:hypothetical protein